MLYKIILILLTFLTSAISSHAQIMDTIGTTIVRIDSLIGFNNGIVHHNSPWDLHWGPDDKLWFTAGATICRYDTSTHTIDTIYVRPDSENCYAMSVATHPNFLSTPIVYVTYDTSAAYYNVGTRMVLYKYDYSIAGDSMYNETAILGWHHPGEHGGARIIVGNDHYLYATTAEYRPIYDTIGDLSGKILRINLDGTVPSINTSGFYDISKGHRNPQGIVQVPNGNIIVSELGLFIDELNLINDYKNYGWPVYDGDWCTNTLPDSCISSTFIHEPPIDTAIRPPSGIDYYNHPAIPELQGCILQSILSIDGLQGGLVASRLNASMDDIISDAHYFKGKYLRWRDVCVSPDGKIFAITNDRSNPRIRVIYNPAYHVGLEEYKPTHLDIYPNPTENLINIQTENELGDWEIISIDGKSHLRGISMSTLFQMDVSMLSSGVYFLKTKWGVNKFVKK